MKFTTSVSPNNGGFLGFYFAIIVFSRPVMMYSLNFQHRSVSNYMKYHDTNSFGFSGPTTQAGLIHILPSRFYGKFERSCFNCKARVSYNPCLKLGSTNLNSLFIKDSTEKVGSINDFWGVLLAPILFMARQFARLRTAIVARNPFQNVDVESQWVKRQSRSFIVRSLEIWAFLFVTLLRWLKLRSVKERTKLVEGRRALGAWIRDSFITLGPTFIKVGQLLSTRFDLFEKEFIEELSALQDRCPHFSAELAIATVEEELGKPINQIFDFFDPEPFAAASLGQVHIAKKNGQTFAVKIQRPKLKELFDIDLKNLRILACILDWVDFQGTGTRNWAEVHDQNTDLLMKEIDYLHEAQNCERFAANFASCAWVQVPKIIWGSTSKKVLCMEYLPGIKINDFQTIDKEKIDRELIAKRLTQCYLEQLCRHGFFHCDQHPGNLAVCKENGGSIIYYDFGMMDELKPTVKRGLVDLIFGIYENEEKEVAHGLDQMGVIRANADRLGLERSLRYFLREFQKTLQAPTALAGEKRPEDVQRELKKRRAELGQELLALERDAPIKFPPAFAFVYRSFASLDGVGKGLSPVFDLTKLAQPYLKELLDVRDGSAAISLLKSFGKKVGWRPEDIKALIEQPRKVKYLEETIIRLEQGDLKPRVRDIVQERALARMEVRQQCLIGAVVSSNLLTLAVLLGGPAAQWGRVLLSLSGLAALQIPVGLAKLQWMHKKDAEYGVRS